MSQRIMLTVEQTEEHLRKKLPRAYAGLAKIYNFGRTLIVTIYDPDGVPVGRVEFGHKIGGGNAPLLTKETLSQLADDVRFGRKLEMCAFPTE